MADRVHGRIKKIVKNRGFAFVTGPGGPQDDAFLHRSDSDFDVFDSLVVGEIVNYVQIQTPKGPRGKDVQKGAL